jgi:hypothetical protein
MSNIQQFSDVEPITVREIKPLRAPRGGEVLGFLGPSSRKENCIVCQETRGVQADGKKNYYRKLGGYSFDVSAVDKMRRTGVDRVVIDELDTELVFEFDLGQFTQDGGEVDGIEQVGVPLDEAIHKWTADEATILRASDR